MKTDKHIDITAREKQQLIKSQQGELDAVILYKKLAMLIKKQEHKDTFLKIAADEGKHAAIIRTYTQENLRPKKLKARVVTAIYRVFGLKKLLKILSKGELKAAKEYESLQDRFPAIKDIIKDEERHGSIMDKMLR